MIQQLLFHPRHTLKMTFSERKREKETKKLSDRIAALSQRMEVRFSPQRPSIKYYSEQPNTASTFEEYLERLYLFPGEVTISSREEVASFIDGETENVLDDRDEGVIFGERFYLQGLKDLTRSNVVVNDVPVYFVDEGGMSAKEIVEQCMKVGNISVSLVNLSVNILSQGFSAMQTGYCYTHFFNPTVGVDNISNVKRIIKIETRNESYLVLSAIDIWCVKRCNSENCPIAFMKSVREFVIFKDDLKNKSPLNAIVKEFYSPWFSKREMTERYVPYQANQPSGAKTLIHYRQLLPKIGETELINDFFVKAMAKTKRSKSEQFRVVVIVKKDDKTIYDRNKQIGPVNIFQDVVSWKDRASILIHSQGKRQCRLLRTALVAAPEYLDNILQCRYANDSLSQSVDCLSRRIDVFSNRQIRIHGVYRAGTLDYLVAQMALSLHSAKGMLHVSRRFDDIRNLEDYPFFLDGK